MELNRLFRPVLSICLHRYQSSNWILFLQKTAFTYTYATCPELPSNMRTMIEILLFSFPRRAVSTRAASLTTPVTAAPAAAAAAAARSKLPSTTRPPPRRPWCPTPRPRPTRCLAWAGSGRWSWWRTRPSPLWRWRPWAPCPPTATSRRETNTFTSS